MAEVFFYHLTSSTTDQTIVELSLKCAARGWRVLVHCGAPNRVPAMDASLWRTGGDESFLAHGVAGSEHDENQPILLSTDGQNKNAAEVLLLVDGAKLDIAEVTGFQRACLLFDGHNEAALTQARSDWLQIKEAGIPAQYWSQADGGWKMKSKTGG